MAPQGRAVVGFGAGRGYDFGDFVTDAAASGFSPTARSRKPKRRRFWGKRRTCWRRCANV